ncbi:MAG: hypothetical protein LBJ23_06730, partial [Tannerella sp.]|nr:hypothetical protein [Tannerella sp.]
LRERVFGRLFHIAEIACFTPEEASVYEDSLKVYRDLKNVIDTAVEEAREEGLKEGLKEGKIEGERKKSLQVVLNCARKGMSKKDTADITGLSVDEIALILEKRIEE